MVYIVKTMRFKREYLTQEATAKLGIHKYTLWQWGEKGWISMYRRGLVRVFDADQIDKLAPKIPKEHPKGIKIFPWKTH